MSTQTPQIRKNQLIKLNDADNRAANLFFCSELNAVTVNSSGQVVTWEEGIRTGNFSSPVYGDFDVKLTDLYKFVENFHAGTAGQKILFDYEHQKQLAHGSPFEVIDMKVEGNRLLVHAAWTTAGRAAVKEQGFRYLSLEFHPNFIDNEKRGPFGPTVVGGAITIRPFVKRMQAIDPHKLSDLPNPAAPVVFYNPKMESQNMGDLQTLKNYLTGLVSGGKMTVQLSEQLIALGEKLCAAAGDDKEQIAVICSDIQTQANSAVVQLAEGKQNVTITLNEGKPAEKNPAEGAKHLTATEVGDIVTKALSDNAAAIQAAETTAAANKTAVAVALSEIEGITEDEKVKTLALAESMLANTLTAEGLTGVIGLAKNSAEQLVAMRKLSEGGIGGQGQAAGGQQGTESAGAAAQKLIDGQLSGTSYARQNNMNLSESAAASIVLSQFDSLHGNALEQERIALSEGTDLGDTNLPKTVQRAVIREALADMKVLDLVAFDFKSSTGTTVDFPYEVREGDIYNYGITAEGQGMQILGVQQKMDSMVLVARKLAMKLSNEVMHFSKVSMINWDALARAIATNAERMRESMAAWVINSLVRYADAFEAIAITGEDIGAQLDGSNSLIKLAQFPLVAPHQQVDIRGENVGVEENPIALVVNSVTITPWVPAAPAGTYYRVEDHSLGLVRLVNETGAAVTPSTTGTIGYSQATNLVKLDEDDHASLTDPKERYDVLLDGVGDQQAFMKDNRFVGLNFMLSSSTFNNKLSKARGYVPDKRIEGNAMSQLGNAAGTKGMPFFETNRFAHLGQNRCLLGVRGAMSVIMSKAYTLTSQAMECTDATGAPTGEKMYYGEEYVGIKVPLLLQGHFRSVLWYSSAKRDAMG